MKIEAIENHEQWEHQSSQQQDHVACCLSIRLFLEDADSCEGQGEGTDRKVAEQKEKV